MSLRTDERSWLIYDDESIGAVVRMMEAYAMSVTGQRLARDPDQKIRALGNVMVRVAGSRAVQMLRDDGANRVAAEIFAMLGMHLGNQPHDEIKCLKMRDELHAAVMYLDSRASSMGSKGPGVLRRLIRGD